MRVESRQQTVSELLRLGAPNIGLVRSDVQEAALMLFPLPPVIINADTKEVYLGTDVISSLAAFRSNVRYQERRIEETRLTVYWVMARTEQDESQLNTFLSTFR